MLRKILTYGVIAGLVVGVLVFAETVGMKGHSPSPYAVAIGYLTMLIALTAVFAGIKRYRDEDRGGVVGFWPAFALGVGISVVAGIFYVFAWEATVAFTHMDFANDYARFVIEQEKAKGTSGEALAKLTAEMEQFKVQYANPLFRLPMVFAEIFPVGVLVSLVSAGLLRNRRFLAARRS
jgi:Protein of unknown function (DUF4199)